jgi:hypothetical protein
LNIILWNITKDIVILFFIYVQDMHQESLERIADLEKQLDRAGYEAKAREEMMEDMKESLA